MRTALVVGALIGFAVLSQTRLDLSTQSRGLGTAIKVRHGELICSDEWCEAIPRTIDMAYFVAVPTKPTPCPKNALAVGGGKLYICDGRWYTIDMQ